MLWFWIFMLLVVLLTPIIMIVFGYIFMKKTSIAINDFFGYRSKRSMKNNKTWAYAHQYIGKLWLIIGIVILPLSVIPLIFVWEGGYDTIGLVAVAIVIIQTIPITVSIIMTELALKRKFDDFGDPR